MQEMRIEMTQNGVLITEGNLMETRGCGTRHVFNDPHQAGFFVEQWIEFNVPNERPIEDEQTI